jgi:hypothetical protein
VVIDLGEPGQVVATCRADLEIETIFAVHIEVT